MPVLSGMVEEAQQILECLGLPKEQQNERAALVLLTLLNLKPGNSWKEAKASTLGVRPIMDYAAEHLGKRWAENTRETIRRFTLHQMIQAGLVVRNPDDPARAVNSPHNVYQIEKNALQLIRAWGTGAWEAMLATYLDSRPKLIEQNAAERNMLRIPVTLADDKVLLLEPGGQNPLVRLIVEDFCPRFTPGGVVIYVGDVGKKYAHYDSAYLAKLGVQIPEHGQIPDVIVHFPEKNWLVLIEAVTSHGPMSPHRLRELKALFKDCTAGLVFVTAFEDKQTFLKYFQQIAWETDVWLSSDPTHMIHLNGSRFLGPY
jgi:type II restriction enzyme